MLAIFYFIISSIISRSPVVHLESFYSYFCGLFFFLLLFRSVVDWTRTERERKFRSREYGEKVNSINKNGGTSSTPKIVFVRFLLMLLLRRRRVFLSIYVRPTFVCSCVCLASAQTESKLKKPKTELFNFWVHSEKR